MNTEYFQNEKRKKHKDRLMTLLYLASITLLIIFISFNKTTSYASNVSSELLIQLTNSERHTLGINPLTVDDRLTMAAYIKAYDMIDKQYWAHYGPSGENPWSYILYCDYDYTIAGENLAYNFSNSFEIHQAWITSELHRKNIINPKYTNIGIAIVNGHFQGKDTTVIVQLFGTENPNSINQTAFDKTQEKLKVLYPTQNSELNDKLSGVVGVTDGRANQEVHVYIENENLGTAIVSNGSFSIRTEYTKSGEHNLIALLEENGQKIDQKEISFKILSNPTNKITNLDIDHNQEVISIELEKTIAGVSIKTPEKIIYCDINTNRAICSTKNLDITNPKNQLIMTQENTQDYSLPLMSIIKQYDSENLLMDESSDKPKTNLQSLYIPIALAGVGVFELVRQSMYGHPSNSNGIYRIIIMLLGIVVYFNQSYGIVS